MTIRIHQLALLSSAALMSFSSTYSMLAHAETASDTTQATAASSSSSTELEEIMVTAQRREQRIQDVPISVAVTSGESIAKMGTTDLMDLSIRQPAVHIGTGVQSNNIHIRGVGSGLNAGFEQAVGTFVDGVYRPRSRTTQAGLFDVERVEVLNGPQTTFFGNNTVAGALNITTRKPSRDFGYDTQILYAPTDGQFLLQGALTGPLSNTLSARFAAQFSGMEGYTHNEYSGSDGPRMRDGIVRASLRWEPSDAFRSDLRVDYAINRDKSTFNAEITGCPPPAGYPAARGPCLAYLNLKGTTDIDNRLDFHADTGPSAFNLDVWEGAWTNRLSLDGMALNSISGYSYEKANSFINATPLPVTGVAGYFYNPFRQIETYKLFTQELRLESDNDNWLQYMAGAYYSHGDLDSDSYASLFNSTAAGTAGAPVTSASTPIGNNRSLYQIDQTLSGFGQLTAKLGAGFKASAGLRYTRVTKDASRRGRVGIGSPTADPNGFIELDPATQAKIFPTAATNNNPFTNPHKHYSKLMPSANVSYDITSEITGYASYTKGFKAGGFSDSNTPAQFDSENVDSYELGIKGTALERDLFFTADVFYEDFKDLQQALSLIGPTGAIISTVGNAASSVSKGVEFSTSYRIIEHLNVNVSGAYIKSYFTDYKSAACTILQIATAGSNCVQDLSGRPTAFAPRFSATAGFTWTVPTSDEHSVRIEPNVFYSSGYYLSSTDDELVYQPSYKQIDLRLGYGPDNRNWEVALIGKNLNDAKVRNSASAIATAPGLAWSLLQRSRSVALSFSMRR